MILEKGQNQERVTSIMYRRKPGTKENFKINILA